MSWFDALVPALAVLAAFYLPGFLVLKGLRLSTFQSLALAPAASAAVAAVGTMACLFTGIRWTPASAAAATLVSAAAAFLLGWLVRPPAAEQENPLPRPVKVLAGCTLAAAAVIIASTMMAGMGSPGLVSQGWDPTYHVNVLQWIKENGQASPWSVLPIFGGGTPSYYPTGWHALVSLAPGDVVVAGNVAIIIIGAVIWPMSLAYLGKALFPNLPAVMVLSPLVGSALLAFPYVQIGTKGQWPAAFAMALVPAVLALGIEMQFRAPQAGRRRRIVVELLALLLVTAGTIWIHPSALFGLLALAGVYMIRFVVLAIRREWQRDWRRGLGWAAATVLLLVGMSLFLARSNVLEGVINYPRNPYAPWQEAVLWAVFDLPNQPDHRFSVPGSYNYPIAVLMVAGAIIALWSRRARPAVAGMVFAGIIFVLAAGDEKPFRWLAGFWYKEPARILPLVLMLGAVFAALALAAAGRLLVKPIAALNRTPGRQHLAAGLVGVAALGVIYSATGDFRYQQRYNASESPYSVEPRPQGRPLSAGEEDFMRSLKDDLPADAVVIGDPFSGLPHLYALTGRHVVFPQMVANKGTKDEEYLRHHFQNILTDPEVCGALQRIGAQYVYADSGAPAHRKVKGRQWPGFRQADYTQGFQLLDASGTAALYRITACR